jgi:hypothetical protein
LKADEYEEVNDLAQRHLKTCEVIYHVATERGDIEIAVYAARSALSVAMDCTVELGNKSCREIAILWNERLAKVYAETTPPPDYLSRVIKWAARTTGHIFGSHEANDNFGNGSDK